MQSVKLRPARREQAKFAASIATSVETVICVAPLREEIAVNCPVAFRLEK